MLLLGGLNFPAFPVGYMGGQNGSVPGCQGKPSSKEMPVLVVASQTVSCPELVRVGLWAGTNRVTSLFLLLLNLIFPPLTKRGEAGSLPLLHYDEKTCPEILRGKKRKLEINM